MRTPIATIIILVALATALQGLNAQGDAREAIAASKRGWARIPTEFPQTERVSPDEDIPEFAVIETWAKERSAALAQVAGFHGADVAAHLQRLAASLEKELAANDAQRAALQEPLADAFESMMKSQKGKRLVLRKGMPVPPGYVKWDKKQREYGILRVVHDGLEAQGAEIRRQVGDLDQEGALAMLAEVFGGAKLPLALKLATTRRVASFGAAMVPELGAALAKAREPAEITAVLDAVGLLRQEAHPLGPQLVVLLDHKDEAVRERAAMALAHIALPAAIEPMLGLLARERGLLQRRVADSLEILTTQQFGTSVGAWQKWWQAEGADWAAGKHALGGGKPSRHAEFNEKNYYYGIRQEGKAILYILDCSGSMTVAYKNPRFSDPEQNDPVDAGPGEVSRMDACKQKLSEALAGLSSDQRFNILWYNFAPHLYKPKMLEATPKNVQGAQEFLKTLGPNGGTNIHDAMQLAFEATGRGTYDRGYGIETDMIFLLTDGQPTLAGKGDGKDLAESILAGVRKWNALQRVVVHTIGIGEKLNDDLMRKLAEENGGQYRKEGGKEAAK